VRCKTCHYSLEGLTEHRCPECGIAFDPNDPSTFGIDRRRQHKVRLLWVALAFLAYMALLFLVMIVFGHSHARE
jgi:hypothetical protein